jgi:hypothetical protein
MGAVAPLGAVGPWGNSISNLKTLIILKIIVLLVFVYRMLGIL